MNDCAKIQEMISGMLDGALSAKDEAEVHEHIARCPECAAMYADFAALSEGIGELCAEVPASLHDRIMKGVRTTPKPKKSLFIALRPYMSAAACLVVVIGAVLALRGGGIDKAANDAASPATAYDMPAAAVADSAEDCCYGMSESAIYQAEPGEAPDAKHAAETPAEMAPDEPACEPAAPEAEETCESGVDCDGDVYIPEIVPGDHKSLTAHFLALFDIGLTANDIELEEGMELENAYIALISPERDAVTVHAVEDTAALVSALTCENREITHWPMYPSALVEFEYGGEYYCFPIYFDGEKVIVTTVERSYYAHSTAEEFLSIK